MKYNNIKKYIEDLSSKKSMPGGGSVAALIGSFGMSLILMVCNLTLGKEKYKKSEKLVKKSIKDVTKYRDEFLKLMDKDMKCFKNIEKVFKMKKDTEEEKVKRKKAMEKACKICCNPPKEMIELAKKGYIVVENLIGKTNKSAASDLEVAKICFDAAKKSAYQNLLINFESIDDKKFIKNILMKI